MQEVFDKIIEKLNSKKTYFQGFYECEGKTEHDSDLNKATQLALDDAIEIVKQEAEQYTSTVHSEEYEEGFEDGAESVRAIAPYQDNGWISCSDRLPNKEEYLRDNGRFIVTDGNRRYQAHFDIYEKHEFGAIQLNDFYVDECVIAWQPLPPEYKPKGE